MAGKTRQKQIYGDVDVLGATAMTGTLAVTGATTMTGALTATGGVDATAAVTSDLGVQDRSTAVTATADGLTTGLIPSDAGFVAVTATDANHIVTLPDGAAAGVGMRVTGYVGANGCEMRTPASSTATINNVNADGTNEAAIPATTMFEARLVAANTWILRAWTELGAVITAIVPDAA